MNILLCNERFLFRYGVDRSLITLGKGFNEAGHRVSIMGNHFDKHVVDTFAEQAISIPVHSDYLTLNEHTNMWLEENWNKIFNGNNKPEVVLIGGWPFYSAIQFFKKQGLKVVYLDCGGVPLEGYTGKNLEIQTKLRELRKTYLKNASYVVGISDFITNSQSKADTNNNVPVQTVYLGADHMDKSIWSSVNNEKYAINLVNKLKSEGKKIILSLGRWEPGTYKNSDAAFDIMRRVQENDPNSCLLILSDRSNTYIPPSLKNVIFPIGFPTDDDLVEIMKMSDLGLSLSNWEGFNLPLVEMQWLNRSVLAFNKGANSEVILNSWYLCENNMEMIRKVTAVLKRNDIDNQTRLQNMEAFRIRFKWERAIKEFLGIFQKLQSKHFHLVIDVSASVRDNANPGIIRVARRISREIQNFLRPIFVVWDSIKECYVLPNKKEYTQLSQYNGPNLDPNRISPDNNRVKLHEFLSLLPKKTVWLLLPEIINKKDSNLIYNYARKYQFLLASIFYDSIPVLRPDLCSDIVKINHRDYMKDLAKCDVVIPISNFSATCLKSFWNENKLKGTVVTPNILPGEFGGTKRSQVIKKSSNQVVNILCVSTLEPRKNHIKLIQACLLMQTKRLMLNWRLTIVGNRYAGNTAIPKYIESISKKNRRIRWLGVVNDAKLHALYQEADFTVYPSIIEGFGMPIMESIWHGRPCICSKEGVMAELASQGGCLTTDVLNVKQLSDAIFRLSVNKQLSKKLAQEAIRRKIKKWNEYAMDLLSILEKRQQGSQLDGE